MGKHGFESDCRAGSERKQFENDVSCSKRTEVQAKEQVQTSDIVFLQKLCKAAGLALKVTTLNIVIYDAEEYDSKPPIKTIKYGSGDYISYKLGTSLHDTAYTSCHVSYTDPDSKETIESTYTADSTEGTGQKLEVNEKVSSTSEAYELAKNGCAKRIHSSSQPVSPCLVTCSWWLAQQSN